MQDCYLDFCMKNMHAVKRSSICWPVLMCWLCCPCWLCWLAFGCSAPCGWAGCCGAPGGVGCWTWGCGWVALWGGMTPVAVKNWLMEEHRSAIWAASSDQLLSSACRMLSFRAGRQTEEVNLDCDGHCRALIPLELGWNVRHSVCHIIFHISSFKVILDKLSFSHIFGSTGS